MLELLCAELRHPESDRQLDLVRVQHERVPGGHHSCHRSGTLLHYSSNKQTKNNSRILTYHYYFFGFRISFSVFLSLCALIDLYNISQLTLPSEFSGALNILLNHNLFPVLRIRKHYNAHPGSESDFILVQTHDPRG